MFSSLIDYIITVIYGFCADKNNDFLKTDPEREQNIKNFYFLCTSFLKRRSTGFSFEGKFTKHFSAREVGKLPVHNLQLSLNGYCFRTCFEA